MTKIAIVAGAFHRKLVEEMLEEAKRACKETGLQISEIVWVPGSLEKPLALKIILSEKNVDGAVVLGIIEKGQTKHGRVMGEAVMKSIIELQLEYMKPIGVGILGPEIEKPQIEKRLLPYARGAVLAVKAMIDFQNGRK